MGFELPFVTLMLMTTMLTLFFYCIVLELLCSYSTQGETVATSNFSRLQDLPPAYKGLYEL